MNDLGTALTELKKEDSKQYYAVMGPHLVKCLQECEVPEVLNAIAYNLRRYPSMAEKNITGMMAWYDSLLVITQKKKRRTNRLTKQDKDLLRDLKIKW